MTIPEINNQTYTFHPGELLPELDGHISRGRFERVLRNGDFAVTAELAPPDSTDTVSYTHLTLPTNPRV